MNSICAFVLLLMSTAALPAAAAIEDVKDARTVLTEVAKAMGADGLKAVHYSGTGSSYIVTPAPVPAGGWPHSVMKSYLRDIDLDAKTSRLQLVRAEGSPPVEKTLTHEIDENSPWSSQYEFWITPYGFLKGAMANTATVETKTEFGATYKIVAFTLPNGHNVVAHVNDKNMIEKVETNVGEGDRFVIEALYRDYTDFYGVKFPTLITEKYAGRLSLILVVKEVKPGT
jgi:hypothetical protein